VRHHVSAIKAILIGGSYAGIGEGILLLALFLPLLYSFFPLGFFFSMVNFTYGDRGLDPASKQTILPLLFSTFLWVWGMEILFRGVLLRWLLGRLSRVRAFWIQWVVVMTILVPVHWQNALQMEGMGIFRYFLQEGLLQACWTIFFLRTGSTLVTAMFHGGYDFIRHVIMNDVLGPFDTLYFYASGSNDFYWLIVVMTFLVISLLMLVIQSWGIRARKLKI